MLVTTLLMSSKAALRVPPLWPLHLLDRLPAQLKAIGDFMAAGAARCQPASRNDHVTSVSLSQPTCSIS